MAELEELDLYDIAQGIMEDRERIKANMEVIWRLAREKSENELTYKKAYAATVEKLRQDKLPATIIKEIAEGEVAEAKRDWELASSKYRASLASLEALQTSMQALQSMLRYLDKV